MKTTALGLAALLAVAGTAWAGVADGAHNLNGWNGLVIDQGQLCVPCHAPHNAYSYQAGPLWNHQMQTTEFTRNGEVVDLDAESKLCMSCHDGVTAVGNYGGKTDDNHLVTGDAAIGTTLDDDHPMGVDYPTSGHGWYDEVDDPDEWDTLQGYLADDGTVQCGSCHRAHSASIRGPNHQGNAGSGLCLVCHDN